MKHRGHGWKRRKDFAKGDLVQWNRWYLSDDHIKVDGRVVFRQHMHSHLGIVLRVYRSTSKARCWTADIKFLDPKLNSDYWGCEGHPIPLGCLVRLS